MEFFEETPSLGFKEAVSKAIRDVTVVKGRSRRSEFWWTVLAAVIADFILMFVPIIGGLGTLLVGLAMIPITFRRLHDTGHSGWWWTAGLLLQIIFVVLVVSALIPIFKLQGMMGDNAYKKAIIEGLFSTTELLVWYAVEFIYSIVMLVFLCTDSQKEDNKYGPCPKFGPSNDRRIDNIRYEM